MKNTEETFILTYIVDLSIAYVVSVDCRIPVSIT